MDWSSKENDRDGEEKSEKRPSGFYVSSLYANRKRTDLLTISPHIHWAEYQYIHCNHVSHDLQTLMLLIMTLYVVVPSLYSKGKHQPHSHACKKGIFMVGLFLFWTFVKNIFIPFVQQEKTFIRKRRYWEGATQGWMDGRWKPQKTWRSFDKEHRLKKLFWFNVFFIGLVKYAHIHKWVFMSFFWYSTTSICFSLFCSLRFFFLSFWGQNRQCLTVQCLTQKTFNPFLFQNMYK